MKKQLIATLILSLMYLPSFAVVSDEYYSRGAASSSSSLAGASSSVYNQSANTAIQSQDQRLNNSNSATSNQTVSSGGTSVSDNSVNTVDIPRQAPPAIAPNMAAPGNNSFSGGFSTPFGGVSLGKSTVDGSVRQLNRALADATLAEAMLKAQGCESDECKAFRKYLLKRFSKY
jgi:hypothetical protein